MTPKEKRKLLAAYVELLVSNGYDIADMLGRPLSYYNWDHVLDHSISLKYGGDEEEDQELHQLEQEYLDSFGIEDF